MEEEYFVTIVNEIGLISVVSFDLFREKSTSQLLEEYGPSDKENYIISIRTPFKLEIIRSDTIPINEYPSLKHLKSDDEFLIPDFSLYIIPKSNEDIQYFVFYPSLTNQGSFEFPPFVYGFKASDQSKLLSSILPDILKFFEVETINSKLYINNEDVTNIPFSLFKNKAQKSQIHLKFNLGESWNSKLSNRKERVDEFINVAGTFSAQMSLFRNRVGVLEKDANIFSEFERESVFGPIEGMIIGNTRFTTGISGRNKYQMNLANVVHKFIPDLKESFKEYFANYYTDDMIPAILKRHQNNANIQAVIQKTFGHETSTFQSMAILPIQLLPRYKLLVKDILDRTAKSHPEYKLFGLLLGEFDDLVNYTTNYHLLREIKLMQDRIIPLPENKNHPLTENPQRTFIDKYNVNQSVFSKSTLYLLSDLIILTIRTDTRELEKFRCKYDEFFFIPNSKNSLIVTFYQRAFHPLKFYSFKVMTEVLGKIEKQRLIAIENNPMKNNSLIATEYVPSSDQSIPPMVDSSCCKFKNLIMASSYDFYMTFDTFHEGSLSIPKSIKNVHCHSKLVQVDSIPFLYGGEKYPIPFEYSGDKFVEIKKPTLFDKKKDNDVEITIPNLIMLNDYPKDGRIYHTCCSYKKFIVIYGGYKTEKKNQRTFSSEILLFNIQNNQFYSTKRHESEPEPRYKHSAVVFKNLLIVHGGINCKNDELLDDTWCYNFNTDKWSLLNINYGSLVVPRFGHAAVIVNHFMFVLGGLTNSIKSLTPNSSLIFEEEEVAEEEAPPAENPDSNEDENENYAEEKMDLKLSPAPFCFCLNMQSLRLFHVNIIGNILPGLHLFSAAYDEMKNRIVIVGGSFVGNKFQKYSSIISFLSIPQIFTSSTCPDGDISDENLSLGNYRSRRFSHCLSSPRIDFNQQNTDRSQTSTNNRAYTSPKPGKVSFAVDNQQNKNVLTPQKSYHHF